MRHVFRFTVIFIIGISLLSSSLLAQEASGPPLVIVIDPGHGGKDGGATGYRKITEKNMVLSLAKLIARQVRKDLKAKVYLTRTDDRYLTLEQRNQFADKVNADIFLSIHLNSAKNKEAFGIETYYLDQATDEASRRLAMIENRSGRVKHGTTEEVLSAMIQHASTVESRDLANAVHSRLLKRLQRSFGQNKIRDLKVKTALFQILVGTKSAGVLMELGFISNKQEARRLQSHRYQTQIAVGISDGLRYYQRLLKKPRSDL